MTTTVTLRSARSQDMVTCATILNRWIDATDWMPRIHAAESVVKHYQTEVIANRQTIVAMGNTVVLGFLTLTKDGFITALYVDERSRNQGIGSMLLERAKRELTPEINLYSFEANTAAQRFFARHGFVEVNRTTGDNEEGLPDILLEWRE
jgi:ribosomal protein S18 acetylase RimI-like enzyme